MGRGEGGHLSGPQWNCQIIAEADQADLIEAVIMWLAAAVFSEHVLRLRNDFCIWWYALLSVLLVMGHLQILILFGTSLKIDVSVGFQIAMHKQDEIVIR